jgi:opacity protein-like surface antigen
MKKLITVILVLLVTITVFAQRSEVGLFGGASYYNGDVNPGKPFELSKPAYGVFYRYNFDTRLAVKLGYTKGDLQGRKTFIEPDASVTPPVPGSSSSFKTSINELSAQFEVNFYDFSIDGDEHRVSPYIFGGVGLTSSKVKESIINGTENTDFKDRQSSFVSFPFGLGVKFCPFRNVTTGFEWGMRKTTTDKLDGVYTDPYRVSASNDWYSFAGIWISFRLNFFNIDRCY